MATQSIVEIVNEHIAANRTELPVFDGTSQRIRELMRSEEFDVSEAEKLIGSDAVVAAALLRVANSTFFQGLEKVTSPRDALMRLGSKQVANTVLLIGQKQHYAVRDPKLRKLVHALWRHAMGCSLGGEWLARKLRCDHVASEAFMAGLIHDIGKLFVLRVLDDLKARHASFDPADELVSQLMGSMHCDQGARLLESWNIPDLYAEVVRHHHDEEVDEKNTVLLLVRLVDRACNKLGIGPEPTPEIDLMAAPEAEPLRLNDVIAAELEIRLEDAAELQV